MNIIITSFIGVLLTFMVFLNAELTANIGMYYALIFIHIVGLLGTIILSLIFKNKITYNKNIKLIFYLGGMFGVLTVVSNTVSFIGIGASLTATLALLGQTITSIVVDTYGLMGVEKKPFKKDKLIGLSLILLGIVFMEAF